MKDEAERRRDKRKKIDVGGGRERISEEGYISAYKAISQLLKPELPSVVSLSKIVSSGTSQTGF